MRTWGIPESLKGLKGHLAKAYILPPTRRSVAAIVRVVLLGYVHLHTPRGITSVVTLQTRIED